MKKLKQVEQEVGLSRRQIQNLEKDGLAIKPKDENKDKHGYLQYDEPEIIRLWQIRLFKELGYSKKTMRSIFDNPEFDMQKSLEGQIEKLLQKRQRLDALIEVAQFIHNTGISPSMMKENLMGADFMNYNNLIDTFGTGLRFFKQLEKDGHISFPEPDMDDAWGEDFLDTLDELCLMAQQQIPCDSEPVQKHVAAMHELCSRFTSSSTIEFSWLSMCASVDKEFVAFLEEEFGEGTAEFLFDAVKAYCKANQDKGLKQTLSDIEKTILRYGKAQQPPNCKEVQKEIKRMAAVLREFFLPVHIEEADIISYALDVCQAIGARQNRYMIRALEFYKAGLNGPSEITDT